MVEAIHQFSVTELGKIVFVHGDDCVSAGPPAGLRWLRQEWERTYKFKSLVLGINSEDGDEVNMLSLIIGKPGRGSDLKGVVPGTANSSWSSCLRFAIGKLHPLEWTLATRMSARWALLDWKAGLLLLFAR